MDTMTQHPHGEVTRTIAAWAQRDPFNNVGRWCDLTHTFGCGVAGDRGWSVRQYEGRMNCGCHIYHVTHAELPTGATVSMDRAGNDCMHTTMVNLY